jgi:hypothetical protein
MDASTGAMPTIMISMETAGVNVGRASYGT